MSKGKIHYKADGKWVTACATRGAALSTTNSWEVLVGLMPSTVCKTCLRQRPKPPKGLYQKYRVERIDGNTEKHPDCCYFVLDLTHDPHARPAIMAYAESCRVAKPALAADLRTWLCEARKVGP